MKSIVCDYCLKRFQVRESRIYIWLYDVMRQIRLDENGDIPGGLFVRDAFEAFVEEL